MRRAALLARLFQRACPCRHNQLGAWNQPQSLWPSLQLRPAHGVLQQRSFAAQGKEEIQDDKEGEEDGSKVHSDHEVAVMAYRAAMRGTPEQLCLVSERRCKS